MKRLSIAAGGLCALLFFLALAGLCFYWPDDNAKRAEVVFSFLGFVATLTLIFLTAVYVSLTRELVAGQTRAPDVRATIVGVYPGDPETRIQFDVAVANPSTRATSVRIKEIKVESSEARSLTLTLGGHFVDEITCGAGSLIHARCDAHFESMPHFGRAGYDGEIGIRRHLSRNITNSRDEDLGTWISRKLVFSVVD
jgi:hypothetical protein